MVTQAIIWQCGCGWINHVTHDKCGLCQRTPKEGGARILPPPKQRILTPPAGTILQCLMDAQKRGERIVSVAPHYGPDHRWDDARPDGYLVIVEEVTNG